MTNRSRTPWSVAGGLVAALLVSGMGRAPRAAAPVAGSATVPVRLLIAIENLDLATHPIRVTVDGQQVVHRSVRGASNINWRLGAGRYRRTVRLTTGEHQLEVEEELTHVVQRTPIRVTGPCEVRIGFWPWCQDGRFRQEPHFTVTLTPPAAKGAS